MRSIAPWIPSTATLLFGAGLQVSGAVVPSLGYGLMLLAVVLLVIPAWPYLRFIPRLRLHLAPEPLSIAKIFSRAPKVTPIPVVAAKGLYDFEKVALDAIYEIGQIYHRLGKDTAKFGLHLVRSTSSMQKAKDVGKRLKVTQKAAQVTERYADSMEQHRSGLAQSGKEYSDNILAWLQDDRTVDIEGPEGLRRFSEVTSIGV